MLGLVYLIYQSMIDNKKMMSTNLWINDITTCEVCYEILLLIIIAVLIIVICLPKPIVQFTNIYKIKKILYNKYNIVNISLKFMKIIMKIVHNLKK